MSTVKVTNLQHPSSGSANIELGSDGSVVLPAGFTGGIGSNVVSTTKGDVFSTSSTSFTDVTGLSATITPTSASSKVLVLVSVAWGNTVSSSLLSMFTITDGSNNILLPATSPGSRGVGMNWEYLPVADSAMKNVAYSFVHSPATTSAFTYKVRCRVNGNTLYVNRSDVDDDQLNRPRGVSTITAIEVAA